MGRDKPQSTSADAHDSLRMPEPLHACHAPTGLRAGLKRSVADLGLTQAHTSPMLLSLTWASRATPVLGGRRSGCLEVNLRAGGTPGLLEKGGSRDGPTMQRTRSTLGTLCEINTHHLLHPLGHGQGLPRRGRWGVVQELTALR